MVYLCSHSKENCKHLKGTLIVFSKLCNLFGQPFSPFPRLSGCSVAFEIVCKWRQAFITGCPFLDMTIIVLVGNQSRHVLLSTSSFKTIFVLISLRPTIEDPYNSMAPKYICINISPSVSV